VVVAGGRSRHSRAVSRPTKLDTGIEGWIQEHKGWERDGTKGVVRTYELPSFPAAIAFVVKLGFLAEKHDHHPDVDIRWKRVKVVWSTHDAGGLTRLDLVMAEASDELL
jgi:4a-hydroxytetrahydrobiopterin dehydratase